MNQCFFAGLFLGLIALSLAGKATTLANQFVDFKRFHRYISPETYFYPTASQIVALARAQVPADGSLVIIGGNSIVHGAGQGESELWTEMLKSELPADVGVVNLAFPSGQPTEHGSVAAQALLKEGRNIIYVSPIYPGISVEPDGQQYRYIVWEAQARGMLYPDAGRESLWDTSRVELRIRSYIETIANTSDLWGTLAYHCCGTIWNPLLPPEFLFTTPRSKLTDPLPQFPSQLRYPPELDERAMEVVRSESDLWCADRARGLRFVDERSSAVSSAFPKELLERSVFLIFHRSPRYAGRLPHAQQECIRSHLHQLKANLLDQSIRALVIGDDWTEDDFVDLLHPSASGGAKLAQQVANIVRELRPERSVP